MSKKVHLAYMRSETELGSACHYTGGPDDSKWMLAEDLRDVDCRHCLNGSWQRHCSTQAARVLGC
jgi:hypothetical protein